MTICKIVPTEPGDSGVCLAQGTRVMLGDKEIEGIERITVHFETDNIVTAEIQLQSVVEMLPGVETTFQMFHPAARQMRAVRQVIFEDGEILDLS